jgi:ATP-binding cassette subfamily B multidrug efflux pump
VSRQSSKGVRAAPSPLEALRSVLRLGNERLLDAVDLRALPHVLRRIFTAAWRYKARVLGAVAATLGATVFTLAIPKLLGAAVDRVHALALIHNGSIHASLWMIAGLLILASTGRGLLTMIAGYQGEVVGQRVAYDLRLEFFEKLQRLGFDFHDKVHSGDLITRGMLDLEGVRTYIETGIQRIISLLLLLAIGAWLVFRTDPLLAALSLSFVPVVMWRAARTGLFLRLTWTRLQQRMSVLTRTIEENLQGVRVVRAFAAHRFELARFDAAADVALRLSNDRILIRTGSVTSLTFAFYFSMGLVLLVGGHRVMSGAITIGRLTEFLAFMTVLQTPVRQITLVVNATARAVSSGSRLFEILDTQSAVQEEADAIELERVQGLLRFEGVGFAYRTGGPQVLSDVSFEVRPGKTLGILGAPGAGKSTIAHLISRFYDVNEGRITLDGHDIRNLTLASLRRHAGTVQQDVFLFDSSVSDNVAYTQPDTVEDRVVEAATSAQIHEYVENLPQAYGTHVGERGVGLSGGQRQRLSIARGLLPTPSILVFDDATSAVDAATEHRLRQALQRETAGRTTIIIAHRLSSLMHADEIIVLDQGRIVERGRHAELLLRGGLYAELYDLQADSGSAPEAAPAGYALERGRT